MKKSQLESLNRELDIDLSEDKIKLFDKYIKIFLEKNAIINLISKNDEKFLFEKHIFDSLAINKFLKPKDNETLLDIGTGGGFPAIPVAILYQNLNVYPIDSIKKKIRVIEDLKNELNLGNLFPICDRVENVNQKYDYVTARAVSSLDIILKYAIPKLKTGGYFIAYKSQKVREELKASEKILKSSGMKIVENLRYTLPLEDIYERNLVIFQKAR